MYRDMEEMKAVQIKFMEAAHRFSKVNFGMLFDCISRGEFLILDSIERLMEQDNAAEGIYVSVLAKSLKISSPAVSRSLGLMEHKGLIERRTDNKNRRNTYVYVTEKGRKLRADCIRIMDEFSCRVVTEMGKEDMNALILLWNRLTEIMESYLKNSTGTE